MSQEGNNHSKDSGSKNPITDILDPLIHLTTDFKTDMGATASLNQLELDRARQSFPARLAESRGRNSLSIDMKSVAIRTPGGLVKEYFINSNGDRIAYVGESLTTAQNLDTEGLYACGGIGLEIDGFKILGHAVGAPNHIAAMMAIALRTVVEMGGNIAVSEAKVVYHTADNPEEDKARREFYGLEFGRLFGQLGIPFNPQFFPGPQGNSEQGATLSI